MTQYTCGQKMNHEDHSRKLTIGYVPGDGKHYPMIRLQGKWLEELGFKVGDRVVVVVDKGIIVVMLDIPSPQH